MRKIIFLFLIPCFQYIYSQNINSNLDKITTIEEAEKFVNDNPELIPEIFNISPEIDTLVPVAFKTLKVGNVFNESGNTFKVLSVNKAIAYRVSYVYLDGSKLSIIKINKLRTEIIKQYKKGIKISELAKKYTMDTNVTGDLNWFLEGMMYVEFENTIKTHKLGEIYTVDILSKKWYYVVLKTHNEKEVTKIKMLKVKNNS